MEIKLSTLVVCFIYIILYSFIIKLLYINTIKKTTKTLQLLPIHGA